MNEMSALKPSLECVVDCANILGEVPLWDVAEHALYWVDIEGKKLQRLTPASGEVRVADHFAAIDLAHVAVCEALKTGCSRSLPI
ncbi:SMP-30/gluconolactonase/LRE family protein [Neorhizobium sp. BT27B]|uniref:SMP-30/gluconolactonase/LRE family protein n=1 Tax=Neorhizobium sp. BT27B TaxID=3142625 RepID=UPI003D2770C0